MRPNELSYIKTLLRMTDNIVVEEKIGKSYYRKGSDYRFMIYEHGLYENWKLNFVIFRIMDTEYDRELYDARQEYECETKKDMEWIVDAVDMTDSYAKLEMLIARRTVETKLEAM